MKLLPWILFIAAVVSGIIGYVWPRDECFIEPTADWKWRSCVRESRWDGNITWCSAPMSYERAKWWSDTDGGRYYRP